MRGADAIAPAKQARYYSRMIADRQKRDDNSNAYC